MPTSISTMSMNRSTGISWPSPIVAQPIVARPIMAQPIVAQPIVAQPIVADGNLFCSLVLTIVPDLRKDDAAEYEPGTVAGEHLCV